MDDFAMTQVEHTEALRRLDDLSDLVGHLPVEILAMLRRVLARRDRTAAGVLADLRALDTAARGPALGPQR